MNNKWARRLGLSAFGLLALIVAFFGLLPISFPYDLNLNTPTAVAEQFVNAVIAEDYTTAATFWRASDISNIEANSKLPFREFCKSHFGSSDYTAAVSGTGKNGAYIVAYKGRGTTQSYALYLVRYQGKWRIIEDRIQP